ncbi:MAG: YciI family protein [Actinomycetota bacterium]
MLYVIHMIDRPGSSELRAATSEAHRAFVGRHLDAMLMGGPMLAEDGETLIGSLVVMDFESSEAAHEFMADEPYNKAGLFESVTIRAFRPVVGGP